MWSQAAKLTASHGAATDEFGHSVAVDGDTVVVGAHQDNGPNSGSAYLFTKPKTDGWTSATQTAKLTASDGAGFDVFGYSVAVEGDIVVVGAYLDDDTWFGSGSAYLFTKPDEAWVDAAETAKLTASDGATYDRFGYSVAVDGDTVVVGASWDDGNESNSGSAYAFTISTWTAIPNSETGGENATSYTLTGLTGGVTYTHWVRQDDCKVGG